MPISAQATDMISVLLLLARNSFDLCAAMINQALTAIPTEPSIMAPTPGQKCSSGVGVKVSFEVALVMLAGNEGSFCCDG